MPYWLRGGIIGGVVGIVLLLYGNYCSEIKTLQFPRNEYASLGCPWFVVEGPGLLLFMVLYKIPGVSNIFGNFLDSLTFLNILTIIGWIVIGGTIGFFYNHKNSQKTQNKKGLPPKQKPL